GYLITLGLTLIICLICLNSFQSCYTTTTVSTSNSTTLTQLSYHGLQISVTQNQAQSSNIDTMISNYNNELSTYITNFNNHQVSIFQNLSDSISDTYNFELLQLTPVNLTYPQFGTVNVNLTSMDSSVTIRDQSLVNYTANAQDSKFNINVIKAILERFTNVVKVGIAVILVLIGCYLILSAVYSFC
ncbi:hypothetical protein WICPIJ_000205, partial [Wickerhamomyces pijperi]